MILDARLRLRLGALDLDVEVAAQPGRVLAVLGPNGAGKSTILRCLAGEHAVDEGHVRLGDRVLDDAATRTFVPPEHRRVGVVHQDHLLFPHLSVLENVAFGPRSTGTPKAEARARARRHLEAVGLADRADDRPRRLSGGQSQRVALARALVTEPDLLLLDEPLSALDVTTRATTRRDLRHHLDGYPGIAVLVTHDPLDALMLAEEVIILERGAVTQAGPVAEVTARPRTRYVADLIGTNLYRGAADGHAVRVDDARVEIADPAAGWVHLTISPTAVTLHRDPPTGSARNTWPGTIVTVDMLGERVRVHLAGPLHLVAEITPAALATMGLRIGDAVWASVKATEVDTYPI